MVDLTSGLKLMGIEVSASVVQQELLFLEELLRWNKSVNLTSIRLLDEAIEKHLLDSLTLLPYIEKGGALLDMGSGGGLPGIPLAIARPSLTVTSIDSVGKKINFQKHIKRKLQIQNLIPIRARMEDLGQHLEPNSHYSTVVARAFASLAVICSLAAPWLVDTGQLLVMKGPEGLDELSGLEGELGALGFYLDDCFQYRLPFSGAERRLIVLKKQLA
jgi:16S rRNA (guanine527-N7)-methyltransferase